MSHGLVAFVIMYMYALLVASCAKQNKQAFYNTGIIYALKAIQLPSIRS